MTSRDIRVLLVEDDEIDQRSFLRAFKKLGISNEVIVANNGQEGLDILRGEANGAITRPFMVVTDINMPVMNGIEFIKAIRADEHLHDTLVFVLTTSEADKDVIDSYMENVAGYIVKSDVGANFMQMVSMLEQVMITLRFPIDH